MPRWLRGLEARPWLRSLATAGVLVGLVLGGWVGVRAVESWLFFRSIDREPYRTSHLRIAAKDVVSSLLEPAYDRRLARDAGLPEYRLTLSPRRLEEWHRMLRRVYARGHATPEDQVWLPADFEHRDRRLEIDLRGRGTLFTHYKERKPSFRLRFRRDEAFRGNRQLNLIIPYDQARVVGDTTLFALARQYGLLTQPTRFVTVRLNGDLLGVYQEVEQWGEELAVKQFRSEGFFMSSLGDPKGGADPAEHAGFAEALGAFARCVVGLADDALRTPCTDSEIDALLERYVDREKMSVYLALTTLFGASHAWGEDNLILFYDPPRGRLEPVPWDMGTLRFPATIDDPWTQLEPVKGIGRAFLERPAMRLARNRVLWDMLERKEAVALGEAQRLYDDIRPALDHDLEHSRRYTRRMADYFRSAVERNAAAWREHLERRSLRVEVGAGALRLINGGASTVRVDRIEQVVSSAAGDGSWVLDEPLRVPGRFGEEAGVVVVATDRGPGSVEPARVQSLGVEAVDLVTGARLTDEEVQWTRVDSPIEPFPERSSPERSSPEPWLDERRPPPSWVARVDVEPRAGSGPLDAPIERVTWVVEGTVSIGTDIAMPEGVHLRLEPGARVLLGPGVDFVVRGDLVAEGTEAAPIEIAPLGGLDDPEASFGTFAVVGRSMRPVTATLEHVTVRGGTEGGLDAAHYSGMLSIYDGSLWMRASRILDARGEDGLNVKFGLVDVRESVFARTFSDAVDLDFCRGVMFDNVVRDTGGDGLDFSGSLVLARNNRFERVADKAFSIGERTTVRVDDYAVDGARTGIAVKDRSVAAVHPGALRDLEIGVAVYQKKPVFGSGTIVFEGDPTGGAPSPFLTDPGALVEPLVESTAAQGNGQPAASPPGVG